MIYLPTARFPSCGLGQVLYATSTPAPTAAGYPIATLSDGTVLYSWWNPVDWVSDGAHYVWKGVSGAGGWIWDGAKWVYTKLTDKCTYILGIIGTVLVNQIPYIKDAINKAGGCSPAARIAATAALTVYLTPYLGQSAALVGPIGVSEVVDCVCAKGVNNVNAPTTPPPTGTPTNVAAIAGVLAVGAAALFVLRRF